MVEVVGNAAARANVVVAIEANSIVALSLSKRFINIASDEWAGNLEDWCIGTDIFGEENTNTVAALFNGDILCSFFHI